MIGIGQYPTHEAILPPLSLTQPEIFQVRMMVQRELNGKDKLSMQLKILSPDGIAGPELLKLCKNCGKIAHRAEECMSTRAPREEVKHMEMLLNLHRKHYAICRFNMEPEKYCYWL